MDIGFTDSNTTQICCRCRDPITRRRAISLLRKCSRSEGAWDSFSASKVAQRVVDIEEADLLDVRSCEDVPIWTRISNVSSISKPVERRATLTYAWHGNGDERTGRLVEEVIEW